MQQNDYYVDEFENIHYLSEELGRGGQGVVYRCNSPDTVIKLELDKNGEVKKDEISVKEFHEKISCIKLLPLPTVINIAMPLARLKNTAGYVMTLLEGMNPLQVLFYSGKQEALLKELLQEDSNVKDDEKPFLYYIKTGGIRKRLEVLWKCAVILSELHSRGIYYGDISLNNIFISLDSSDTAVWFIDSDNMNIETAKGKIAIYTPKYGAPELCSGESKNNTMTDCYSFAVLVFYLLTQADPFNGALLYNNTDTDDWADSSDDWDNEENTMPFEKKVELGLVPWVLDPNDTSNSLPASFIPDMFLTDELLYFLNETFSRGKLDPFYRPTMLNWVHALAQAYYQTIECPKCGLSYYNHKNECPYCITPKPLTVKAVSYLVDSSMYKKTQVWEFAHEVKDEQKIELPLILFVGFSSQHYFGGNVSLLCGKETTIIKNCLEQRELTLYYSKSMSDTFSKELFASLQIRSDELKNGLYLLAQFEDMNHLIHIVLE